MKFSLKNPGELNEMDMGVHMATMEEWNEEPGFQWEVAFVIEQGKYTRVIQGDGLGGVHMASYLTEGEGDLVSLRVYGEDRTGHDYWIADKQDEEYQRAWWDGHDSATGRREPRKKLYTEEDIRAARQEAYRHGRKAGRYEASILVQNMAIKIRTKDS